MVQSDESSTGRTNTGKVRKHPALSTRKLQPCRQQKQWAKKEV